MANNEYDRYAYSVPVAEAAGSDNDADTDETVDEAEETVEGDTGKDVGEGTGEDEAGDEEVEEVVEEAAEPPPPILPDGSAFFRNTATGIERLTQPAPRQRPDDMSDLFRVTKADVFGDTDDLTRVDIERDVLDTDPDGSFDSVLTVTSEDIMGTPPKPRRRRRIIRQPLRTAPGQQMGGIRY